MNRIPTTFALGAFVFFAAGGSAAPNPDRPIPAPDAMQQLVWENTALADFRLEGMMRTQNSLHPIILRTRGREMVYEFVEQPLQIRVIMTDSGSIVQNRRGADEPWKMVAGADRQRPILDSDVLYEDLGLDFLRWSSVRPLGIDSIKTLSAWAYETVPPVPSSYAKAQYWISADHLAVLRVDAFNDQDQVVKRVEVNGVMRVGDVHTIKEMQISSIIPGRNLSRSRTYIEIRKAEQGSGLGG